MYKIIVGFLIGLACAIGGYIAFDKYISPSFLHQNMGTGEMMTGEILTGAISTGDILSGEVSDEEVLNIALGGSLLTGENDSKDVQTSEQWNDYGEGLSSEYDGYKDHIKEFIRLNPSSRNIPKEYIGCDIYDPNFSAVQLELYNKLLPYYDAKTDRWLVDIRNQRDGYEDNDLSYVSNYIQYAHTNQTLLQNFLAKPDTYYIKKNITSYGNNEKGYEFQIYDLTKKVTQLTEDAQAGLQKARKIIGPMYQWRDGLAYININLYDLEAIQRYVQTFTPECYIYDQYQKPQFWPYSIHIKNIIQDLEKYGRGEQDLFVKSTRFEGSRMKILEQTNNYMMGFVYDVPSDEIKQTHTNNPITLFDAWIYDGRLNVLWETPKGEMGFHINDSYPPEDIEYHKGRLIGKSAKNNGKYPKLVLMQSCWNYYSKIRGEGKFDRKLYDTCISDMDTYLDGIITGTIKSDYITSAIESLKELFH